MSKPNSEYFSYVKALSFILQDMRLVETSENTDKNTK